MSVSRCPPSVRIAACMIIGVTKMMNIVAANHVARTCTANVDSVAVAHLFHHVMDLVVFDAIVMRVKIGANIFQRRVLRQVADFMPPDGSAQFPAISCQRNASCNRR